ncbi:MAG: hypothetical protein LBI15_12115 [Dysgonamonadaceae bacterium]|jgi:hypothetical protein|nr:hypothetical protein [Dysgonamonadaceae bacterium]
MKYINLLFLVLLSLTVLSCDKNDKDENLHLSLSPQILNQTVWSGIYSDFTGFEKDVTIFFKTYEEVEYTSGWEVTKKKYTASGNMIFFEYSIGDIGGNWLATKKVKDEMRLEKNMGTQYHTVMILSRIYPE